MDENYSSLTEVPHEQTELVSRRFTETSFFSSYQSFIRWLAREDVFAKLLYYPLLGRKLADRLYILFQTALL